MAIPPPTHLVLTTARLRNLGVTKSQLAKLVESGQLERVRRGSYVQSGIAPQARLAAMHHATLTCANALRQHGIWALEPDLPHLAIAAHDRRPRVHAEIHWRGVHDRARIVDPPLVALQQFAACGSYEHVMAAADSIVNLRLATESEVLQLLLRSRHRRGAAALDGASQSGIETIARLALRRRGIRFRTQVDIRGVGRVDLVIGDRLVLELDGRSWHTGDRFESDRARDLELTRLGYVVVRVSYRQVMQEWGRVEAALLELIRRREHVWRARHRPCVGDS